MIIQPFTKEYTEAVIQHILSIQVGEFGVAVTRKDQPDLENIPAIYQYGGGNFWLALEDGQVVGTIALLDTGEGVGALRKMFVAPAFRGKEHGTAQKLLEALLAHAPGAGIHDVYLGTTSVFLAAHRFYERNGFTRVEREAVPPSVPLMAVDSIFYYKSM